MQSVSYMGNDETTEFYFNFPYFETSNIVVTVNNAPAPTYNIIGTPGGENADFPFVGGRVVFAVAPHITDSITISRQLPMTRIADYQPFARIEPTTLNQDLNYLMEVIKDRKDELDDLITKYADIADKESTATLLARISAIHDEIVAIDAKITALGDISTLRDDVTTNSNNIATNTGDIANLKDAANFSATGRAAISHLAMPSNSYINLTVEASGTQYTAPADGYVSVHASAVGVGGTYIELVSDTAPEFGCSQHAAFNGVMRLFMPVAKNSKYRLWYNGPHFEHFRFYYAIGVSAE